MSLYFSSVQDETLKYCPVTIIDDSLYEENESFKVVLHPYLDAAVGPNYASTEIIILADGKDGKMFLVLIYVTLRFTLILIHSGSIFCGRPLVSLTLGMSSLAKPSIVRRLKTEFELRLDNSLNR